MKPSVMCRSAAMNRSSTYTGVPDAVVPRWRWEANRERHDSTTRTDAAISSPQISRISASVAGTVQAGGDQNRDVLARDARLFQAAKDGRKRLAIGRRPRDVANRDGGALFPRANSSSGAVPIG
jgi:hypothetical protein